MTEFVKKLIERLEEEAEYQYQKCDEADELEVRTARISMAKCYIHVIEIVNQLAEEYQPNQAHQFAILHADILARLGIDISEKWETGTQQAEVLEQAYLRGRQDEKEASNDGWILCSDRLPETEESEIRFLVADEYDVVVVCCWDHQKKCFVVAWDGSEFTDAVKWQLIHK